MYVLNKLDTFRPTGSMLFGDPGPVPSLCPGRYRPGPVKTLNCVDPSVSASNYYNAGSYVSAFIMQVCSSNKVLSKWGREERMDTSSYILLCNYSRFCSCHFHWKHINATFTLQGRALGEVKRHNWIFSIDVMWINNSTQGVWWGSQIHDPLQIPRPYNHYNVAACTHYIRQIVPATRERTSELLELSNNL